MFINFKDLPGQHQLFLDYLYEYENVENYYRINFRNKRLYPEHFENVLKRSQSSRTFIIEELKRQYGNLQPSAITKRNIEKLLEPNTLAIFTGQQLGLAGGPLYTFYKIISAIKLAAYLGEKYGNYNFVPVFWLPGDDHDFEEIRSVTLADKDKSIRKIEYPAIDPENQPGEPVGKIKFDSNISAFIKEFESTLQPSNFKSAVIDLLKRCYAEGMTVSESFANLIFTLFDNRGLIIFNPQTKKVKSHLTPIFKKELDDFRLHTEKLILTSARLEESYHAQVKIAPVNLFLEYRNGRHSIEPTDDGGFTLRRKRIRYSKEEIADLLENESWRFSANVLLRPITQDYLFPTAAYVAGPSEVSYFAQIAPLYDLFNLQMPIIYPRASATLIEKHITKIIETYSLKFNDFFTNPEQITRTMINEDSEVNLQELFSKAHQTITSTLNEVKEGLNEIDKTVADSSDRYRDKIKHQLNELRGKAEAAQKRRYEIAAQRAENTLAAILPGGNMQERVINYFYFANKYDVMFINFLFDELSINRFEHQIIKI